MSENQIQLHNFDRLAETTLFDLDTGTGTEFERTGKLGSGLCKKFDVLWVAVYSNLEAETLIVQIDEATWDLSDETVDITYYHDYDAEETHFSIEDSDDQFEVTYEAWWKDQPDFEVNRWAASEEPENADEDIFGFIRNVWEHTEDWDHYLEQWNKDA